MAAAAPLALVARRHLAPHGYLMVALALALALALVSPGPPQQYTTYLLLYLLWPFRSSWRTEGSRAQT